MSFEPQRTGDLRVDPAFFDLLTGSHARLVRAPLLPEGRDADWLYNHAPRVVLAHDTQPDPRFVYANKAGQALFGYTWDEFTALPSRLSSEAPNQEERQQFLQAVARSGYMTGYRGLRISKAGLRFWIEDATVWQLFDSHGVWHGQAATFTRWTGDY